MHLMMAMQLTIIIWLDCELPFLLGNMLVLGVLILRYWVYNKKLKEAAVAVVRVKMFFSFHT